MIDAATLAPLRTLVERVLALSDVDAACAVLFAQGLRQQEVLAKLSIACGEAERLADALESPEAAREYERRLADTFAPFADIVRAILPESGTRYVRTESNSKRYRRTTLAAFSDAEAKRREAEARRREAEAKRTARHVATYAEAAATLHIKRNVVREYVHTGKLVGVYCEGQNCAYGVTRQSLYAYAQKQERRAAATVKAGAIKARRKEWRENGGVYYTQDGRKIYGAERISAEEVAATFGRSKSAVMRWANKGRIERVYIDAERNHPAGYLRATVEKWAMEREAIAAAGGIYYTVAGRIVGAERVSREEAARRLHVHENTATVFCRRGELEHVYADAALTIPCGYTRKSVEAYAQAHPTHIPAKRAVAAPDFMIAPLPPPPRNHGLRAARLDPDATGEAAGEKPAAVIEGEATRTQRRRKPTVVFMLAAWNAATTSEEKERNMENETNEKPAEASPPTAPGKLEIAKAYTVHEAGVIRAICVSEADRDEIVEALRLYRRARAKPGEVESALQLLRAAREIVGTSATAEPEAPDATPAAVTN